MPTKTRPAGRSVRGAPAPTARRIRISKPQGTAEGVQSPVVVATPERLIPLQRPHTDEKGAAAGLRSFQRAAMQWSYIVRNRRRWSGREALVRDQVADAQTLLQAHFGIGQDDLLAVSEARVAQVAIPYRTEEEGWENRVFPWEFVISAATRPLRQKRPLTILRQLVREGASPTPARAPKSVLYVESAPDRLATEYSFESESALVRAALAPTVAWHEIRNPTRAQLEERIAGLSPDIIHLAGFDTHEGRRLIEGAVADKADVDASSIEDSAGKPKPDGYILAAASGAYDPVDAESLARILCAGTHKPLLVTCNLWNSASRTCPLIVAAGAGAAVGFQDSFDDEAIESFLSAFYTHWRLAKWELPDAFCAAWDKVRQRPAMIGTGVVLWTDRRIVGESSRAVEARTSKVKEQIEKAAEQVIDPKGAVIGQLVSVAIKPAEELNYSLLHNRRPLFETFKLVKKKPGRMESLMVTVDLNAGAQTFPYRRCFDVTDNELDLRSDIHAPLTADLVRSLREAINSSLYVEVSWDSRVLYRDTHRVRLLPADQWRDTDEDRKWLPCFVLPRDPAVGDLIEKAHRYVRVLRDDPGSGFDGYQSVDSSREDATEDVDLQVQAIWSAILHEWELGYVNPPPTYSRELDSQRLRTPSAILEDRSGTCIDLTLLVAACLELVDIYPVIFLLDGHAFPGYWRSSEAHEEFLKATTGGGETPNDPRGTLVTGTEGESWISGRQAYDEIVRQVDQGNLVPLESVKLTENCGFWEAVEAGRENLKPKKEFHSMIDVLSARFDRVTPLPITEVRL